MRERWIGTIWAGECTAEIPSPHKHFASHLSQSNTSHSFTHSQESKHRASKSKSQAEPPAAHKNQPAKATTSKPLPHHHHHPQNPLREQPEKGSRGDGEDDGAWMTSVTASNHHRTPRPRQTTGQRGTRGKHQRTPPPQHHRHTTGHRPCQSQTEPTR